MASLPDEIWVQVLDYLEPKHLLPVQQVNRRLLKIARDSSLWRAKCFETAPSAIQAFASTDGLADLLNSLSINGSKTKSTGTSVADVPRMSRRARAIDKWDTTEKAERIDWHTEYIARHAPLSTEWRKHEKDNGIRSMALFDNNERILSAMEDGSLHIFDITTSINGRRRINSSTSSKPGLLCTDINSSGLSNPTSSITATDSTLVDHTGTKAYIAVQDSLNEVDLATMTTISQKKYSSIITAISQQSKPDLPLMIGTSFSLHMYDPRIPQRPEPKDSSITVWLPNYSKDWLLPSHGPGFGPRSIRTRNYFSEWAPIEPGPQTILHRGDHEILVAGRMPSILFYDKRRFPDLQSVIHSGARLSSLTTISRPPKQAAGKADATLIAGGEYHGRGSLEVYELPHTRATDLKPTYTSDAETEEEATSSGAEAYKFKNRQSSSSAKILSVAIQGARIVYSDSEGKIHWMERDGRGLARRWNINSYQYSSKGGGVVGESVARKILTFGEQDGDLLCWTGSDLGIVTSKVKWMGHDELVKAFDEMSLDRPQTDKEKEEEYSRIMRRALERQADERRFLARFGRMRS